MTRIRNRAQRIVTGTAIGVALLTPAACSNVKDSLLEAPIPTVIDPTAANSAAGAEALRIGTISRIRQITAGSGAGDSPWMFAGLITDEWKSSDTFSQRNETDQRSIQDNNANLTPILRDLNRVRTSCARGDHRVGHVRSNARCKYRENRGDVHVDGHRRVVHC
jgi:hypothetical protein